MPSYLLTVTGESARMLEAWLGSGLRIGPPGARGVDVAGLDAVTSEETEPIRARLRSGGPLYHAGGPGAPRRKHPDDLDFREARAYLASGYLPLADDDSEAEAAAAEQRAAFLVPDGIVVDELPVVTTAAGHEPLLIDVADLKRESRRRCPDDGACHHECTTGCWRVRTCSPLSAAGWGETWPPEIVAEYGQSDGVL